MLVFRTEREIWSSKLRFFKMFGIQLYLLYVRRKPPHDFQFSDSGKWNASVSDFSFFICIILKYYSITYGAFSYMRYFWHERMSVSEIFLSLINYSIVSALKQLFACWYWHYLRHWMLGISGKNILWIQCFFNFFLQIWII